MSWNGQLSRPRVADEKARQEANFEAAFRMALNQTRAEEAVKRVREDRHNHLTMINTKPEELARMHRRKMARLFRDGA
jgi:hypothetical protein